MSLQPPTPTLTPHTLSTSHTASHTNTLCRHTIVIVEILLASVCIQSHGRGAGGQGGNPPQCNRGLHIYTLEM